MEEKSYRCIFVLLTGSTQLGYSVALSSDSNTAVLGTPGFAGYTGAAWVFTLTDNQIRMHVVSFS